MTFLLLNFFLARLNFSLPHYNSPCVCVDVEGPGAIPYKARADQWIWQGFLRLRLHGSGFQSKRFHDLETASKTARFQRVYTEPIQPFMSRRSRSQAFALRHLDLDLTRHEFAGYVLLGRIQNRCLAFLFVTLQKRINEKVNIAKTSLFLRYGSRFMVKYTEAAKAKLNHRSKL